MDYKEEYQKALERAKKGLPIDEVFPELKDSEDERIRKCIRLCLDECVHSDIIRDYERDECLAYLEKQKERERIVQEREATDFEIEIHEIIAQARSDKRLADKDVLEQFEKEASCALMWKAEKQLRNAEKQKERQPAECWRPSIEQMAMLRAVINDKHNMASASANLALNSLYDDLIKL